MDFNTLMTVSSYFYAVLDGSYSNKKYKTLPHRNPSRVKTHNLCVCGHTKRDHFKNALGHNYRAGKDKNVVKQNGNPYGTSV